MRKWSILNAGNIQDYIVAGAKGVGVAKAIADKKAIIAGNYEKITSLAKEFTALLELDE